MKKFLVIVVLILSVAAQALAQHKGFQTLKDNFEGREEVLSFSVNGLFCRMVLGMAGEWEFKQAIEEVKHIRLMVIPHYEFKLQNLTVGGFRNLMKQDGYEELATIRDGNDHISIYLHNRGNKKNTYFVLVEEPEEIVAIEIKGYINPAVLNDQNTFSKK